MTCYHPLIREAKLGEWETAKDGHKYMKAIIYPAQKDYARLEDVNTFDWYTKKQIIPCRKCIGCRLDYSRDWANRGYLESKKSKDNYFITLTYDDKYLPKKDEMTTKDGITYTNDGTWNGYLEPQHLTDFIHDIRQYFYRKNKESRIKYIACGEYGEKNLRPHYHLIMFNCPFPPESMYNTRIIDNEYYSQNKIIEKYWKRGISNVSLANWNTIAYVCRYVTKKLYGNTADDTRAQKGQTPEFLRMSKGIGKDYWEENKEEILKTDSITIRNNKGVHTTKPPRYYTRLLEKENPETYKSLKKKRNEQNEHNQKIRDTQHTYGRLGELENEERTKITQAGTLKREISETSLPIRKTSKRQPL